MNVPNRQSRRDDRMTAEEYLLWTDEQPAGRFELVDGEVVAMSPEKVAHTLTKSRASFALMRAIEARGLDCQALVDGASVRVADDAIYEPDALVRCGPPLPGDAIVVPDPMVVVEVLSRSTRHVDTGKKLKGYFSLPSVRHYLVLDPEDRTVMHHRRDGASPEGRIETRVLHARQPDGQTAAQQGSELVLDPPGLTIRCADLFEAP